VFTGSVNITGSLAIVTTGTEFQVTSTGVKFGNVSTDVHPITGSVNVSGSITTTGSVTFTSADLATDGLGNVNIFTTDAAATGRGGSLAFGGSTTGGTSPYAFSKIEGIYDGSAAYNGAMLFSTNNGGTITERMRITSTGSIGINTTSPTPSAGLTVKRPTSTGWIIDALNSSNTRVGGFYVTGGGNGQLYLANNPGTENILLDSSGSSYFNGGNVGIGTTSPQSIVHALVNNATAPTSGTTPSGYALSYGTADGNNGGLWFSSDFGGDQGIAGIAASRVSGYTTDLRFYTNSTNSARAFTERMRITSAGDVAINDTTANTYGRLQVTGLSSSGITLALTNPAAATAGGGSSIWFLGTTGYNTQGVINTGYDGTSVSYAYMVFSTRGPSTTERMRITSGGYVGIGVINPITKLSVAGSIAMGNNTDGITNLSYGGKISAKLTTVTGGAGATLIHRGLGSVGYFILVSGIGGPSSTYRFTDLIYGTGTNTPSVLASSTVGSAPTRTYSISSENIYVSLSGGDAYTVTTTGLGAMES
jgi:hypothetical protein